MEAPSFLTETPSHPKVFAHLLLTPLLFPQALVFQSLGSIREKCLLPCTDTLGWKCEGVTHISISIHIGLALALNCSSFPQLLHPKCAQRCFFCVWQLDYFQVPRWALLQPHHWVTLWKHNHFLLHSSACAPYSLRSLCPSSTGCCRFHLSQNKPHQEANPRLSSDRFLKRTLGDEELGAHDLLRKCFQK